MDWDITVHKLQGLTLEKVTIDIGNAKRLRFDIHMDFKSQIHRWFKDITTIYISKVHKDESKCICYEQEERRTTFAIHLIITILIMIQTGQFMCFNLLQSWISMFPFYYNLRVFDCIYNVTNIYGLQHNNRNETLTKVVFIDKRLVLLVFPFLFYSNKSYLYFLRFHEQQLNTLNTTLISNPFFSLWDIQTIIYSMHSRIDGLLHGHMFNSYEYLLMIKHICYIELILQNYLTPTFYILVA